MVGRRFNIDWYNHAIEFLVVIVGILLAFQINQCASHKQQSQIISNHLAQIKEETSMNKASLEASLDHTESMTRILDTLMDLVPTPDEYHAVNQLTVDLLTLGLSNFRRNAFENLTQSGDIRFMTDFESKKSIINLYEYYNYVESYDAISLNLYNRDFYPYLRDHFDLIGFEVQEKDVYTNKRFQNILAAYKTTNQNRIEIYRNCIDAMEEYLSSTP